MTSRLSPSRVPAYCRHKATGQAVVTLDGRDFHLRKFKSPQSRQEYDRLIGEWIAGGRRLAALGSDITIAELIADYFHFAEGYYVKHGQPRIRWLAFAWRCESSINVTATRQPTSSGRWR